MTPTTVRLFTEVEDPLERLRQTARSCREGVELRQAAGVDLARALGAATPAGSTGAFLHHGGRHLPRVNSHVVTANVRGPDHRRWSGGLEITDWISFAIVANPCNINITAHSYADHLSIGLLVGHGVLPEPRRFLERMAWEVEVLDMELSPWRQSVDERARRTDPVRAGRASPGRGWRRRTGGPWPGTSDRRPRCRSAVAKIAPSIVMSGPCSWPSR